MTAMYIKAEIEDISRFFCCFAQGVGTKGWTKKFDGLFAGNLP
jgi:hypothetical protein